MTTHSEPRPNIGAMHYQLQDALARIEKMEAAQHSGQPASQLQIEQIDALLSILPGHPSRPSKLTRDQAVALEQTLRSIVLSLQQIAHARGAVA